MPNWCYNELTITKLKKKDLERLLKDYTEVEDEIVTLVFNKIIPLKKDAISCSDAVEAWGCKGEPTPCMYETKGKETYFAFDTPWSDPREIIKRLSILFPDASFYNRYSEQGNGFMGEDTFKNGELINSMYSEDENEIREEYPDSFEDEECVEQIKQDIVKQAVNSTIETLALDENFKQEEYRNL